VYDSSDAPIGSTGGCLGWLGEPLSSFVWFSRPFFHGYPLAKGEGSGASFGMRFACRGSPGRWGSGGTCGSFP